MRAETETPLLERESSMASLHEYAGRRAGGEGRLVLVAGEAGVGKSAWSSAAAATWPTPAGRGAPATVCSPPARSGRCSTWPTSSAASCAELCRAGADREDAVPGAAAPGQHPPDVLDVVVIEDVHWADEATLDLLRFLGRRLRDARVAAHRHLPRRRAGRRRPAAGRAGRAGLAAVDPAHRAGAAVARRSGAWPPAAALEPARAVPADRRQPVLPRPRCCGPGRRRCRRRPATPCWRGRPGSAARPARCSTWPR